MNQATRNYLASIKPQASQYARLLIAGKFKDASAVDLDPRARESVRRTLLRLSAASKLEEEVHDE